MATFAPLFGRALHAPRALLFSWVRSYASTPALAATYPPLGVRAAGSSPCIAYGSLAAAVPEREKRYVVPSVLTIPVIVRLALP